ncbi:MAG: DUF3808 domain-containing protein [Bacteroidales bacterium]|jgi:tetratricopeptide (TPR) repeat protein|nr:DUF3808 domain-containing protein [Bacteroidales bacterium]
MDNINHSDEFENPEYARLVRLFKKFDAAYKKGTYQSIELSEDEYNFIIDSYVDRDDLSKAAVVSAAAFDKYPYSSDLVIKYCESLLLNDKADEAESVLNKYQNAFPDNSEFYLLYARIFIRRKKWDDARSAFDKAMEVEEYPEDIYNSVHNLAQECIYVENYREAIFYLDRSNALENRWCKKNDYPMDDCDLANAYEVYASCLERIGELEKSLEYYKKSLAINPFDDINWSVLGAIYCRLKMVREAVDALEYAVSLNPNNDSALFSLGIISLNLGEFKNAIKYFTDFCRLEKKNVHGTVGLAQGYMGLGDYGEAEILFRKALMLDKNCKEAKDGLKCLNKIKSTGTGKKNRNKSNKVKSAEGNNHKPKSNK